jgi:hypothetical protein
VLVEEVVRRMYPGGCPNHRVHIEVEENGR